MEGRRERGRQTDKQTGRKAGKQRVRQTDRLRAGQQDERTDRRTDRQIHRDYADRETSRHREGEGRERVFVGCLSSQQHAGVSQGRICTDNFTCCHTEIEIAD